MAIPPDDTPKEPMALRLLWALAWVVSVLLALVLLLRWSWHDGLWGFLVLNMFSLYVFLPVYLIVLAAVLRRRWLLAGLTGLMAIWHLGFVVLPPLWDRTPPPSVPGTGFRLLSANLLFGNPLAEGLAAELENYHADIVLLQEVSPRWEKILRSRGWYQNYPFHWVRPQNNAFGSAIFSHLPLEQVATFYLAEMPQTRALLQFGKETLTILNVHTLPPRLARYLPYHRQALVDLEDWLARAQGKSFIVAGDFNSTRHNRFASRIKAYCDSAWELAGSGYGHTSPNGVFPFPPVQIDHVFLSKDLTVSQFQIGSGTGSDHKALVVDFAQRE